MQPDGARFLSSTDGGKILPAVEAEDDTGGEAWEFELGERQEREEERRAEVLGATEDPGDEEGTPVFLPTLHFMASADGR